MRTESVSSFKTRFCICLICAAAWSALVTGSAAAARFEYAPFVPADDRIYVETAPLSGFMGDVKKFYAALRGPQAENEIMLLGNALRAKIGINPMDPDHLNAAGVQADRPLGMAFEKIDALSKKAVPAINAPKAQDTPGEWTVFLPSRNSATLYKNLKLLFEKRKAEPPRGAASQQQQEGPPVRELVRGSLFQVGEGKMFVGKGGSFVVLASSKKRAVISVKKSRRPLAEIDEFLAFKKHISSRYKDTGATMLSYVNNKGIGAAYLNQILSGDKGKGAAENPIVAESRQNLLCEAGVWMMDAAGLRVHNDSLYAQGYLSDMEKVLPLILNNRRTGVSADHYGKIPAAYANLNFSVNGLMRIIEKLQPDAMRSFDSMNQQFKSGTGKDLRADLIESATGNISLLMTKLPDFNDSQAIEKWDMSIHLGYRPEKRADISAIFGIIADSETKRGGDTRYEKQKIGGEDVWAITTVKQVKQPVRDRMPKNQDPWNQQNQQQLQNQQQQQQQDQQQAQDQQQNQQQVPPATVSTTTYLHLGTDEAVLSFSKKYLEVMLPKKFERIGEPIATRLMGVGPRDLDRTYLLAYLRVDAVIEFLKTSPFIFFAAPVMPYIQNMSDISVASKHEGDVIYSTFNLKLKEGAGFH
ncbi:MAG: hypothetical protein KBA61_09180 [Spirochaetes bacterium]|nr:hypothetical protein [Spirochaetota bacterium]